MWRAIAEISRIGGLQDDASRSTVYRGDLRPAGGKTLLARLLIDFFLTDGRPLEGYDLQPHEPALAKRFPDLVQPIDIGGTYGQMQLFDQLLATIYGNEGHRSRMRPVRPVLCGDGQESALLRRRADG